ncbi:hypothetical protein HD554DRAFT_2109710 [Boletus coccyginus]|nr:hypothetical protein HD554DRAFT_2109710 [Boletus coccyginus]
MELAAHYVHTFVCTFKRSRGPTPSPSEHPSRPSFENGCDYATYYMEERTLDDRSARTWAMCRDNNRCMITGKVDFRQGGTFVVETAHIIPSSVNRNIEHFHSGGVWVILAMFSQDTIGLPHTYRVCTSREDLKTDHSLPEQVTFSTDTGLPLPNHDYLALHALCCEVAWMSGAAEYIMDIERRMDDTKVLANDGSSVDVFMVALSSVALAWL